MTRPVALVAVAAALAWSAPASAATINVTTEADSVANDGACSLREAIGAANADAPSGGASGECPAGASTDTVEIPAGTYTFERAGIDDNNSAGDLDITSSMTVRGDGAENTVVDADGLDRVFQTHGDTTRQVAIESLTVTGGHAQGPSEEGSASGGNGTTPGANGGNATASGFGPQGADGGGIRATTHLTLTGVVVTGNRAGDGNDGFSAFGGDGAKGAKDEGSGQPPATPGGNGGSASALGATIGGDGGGIYAEGETLITASSITDNRAGDGGTGGVAEGGDGGAGGDSVGFRVAAGGGTGGNASGGAGGPGGSGGGIVAHDLLMISSTIARNRSGDGGDGGRATAGRGGDGGTNPSCTGAPGGDGGAARPGPGAVSGAGGGLMAFSGNGFSLTNVTVADNTAGKGGDGGVGSSEGGAGGFAFDCDGGKGGDGGTVTPADGGNGRAPGGIYHAGFFTGGTVVGNRAGVPGIGGLAESRGGQGGISVTGPDGQPGAGSAPTHGPNGSAGAVGGVSNVDGVLSSIVADNTPTNCGGDVGVSSLTLSFPDGTCAGAEVADPKLGPLEDNGGLGETFRLEPGSAALDRVAAGTPDCPATDARGIGRPQGASCDLGAYESALPAATTGGATAISATGATLDGVVRANQHTANIRFEYGPTAAYGNSTAAREAGDGTNDAPVSELVGGLAPNTAYHYRLVASNAAGTTTGADATFTTAAAPLGAPGAPGGPGGGSGGGAGGPGAGLPDSVVPVVQGLSVTRAFRAADSGGSIARAAGAPVGATIRYTISEPGRTTFTVEKPGTGRKVGRRCVKQTRRNKKNKRCRLYTTLRGSFTHTGQAGSNSFKFTGRLNNKKLRPGSYRLVAVTTDAAGNKSAAKRTNFKVVRR